MHRRILLPVVLAFLASLDVPGSLGNPNPPFGDGVAVSAQTPPPVPALPPAQAPPPAQKPPAPAAPAAPGPQSEISGCKFSEMTGATQDSLSKLIEGKTERVVVLTGKDAVPVQVDCDETQFFADFAEIYPDSHRIVATGNVKVGTPSSFITSERVEFDTQTRTGVFYNANGMAALGERVDKSFFGTQEADALFRGREIHKLGPKKYKVVDGAFSTCVQPTPRWEVVSGSATINLDDYALLKNSVFRVKGVPLMYLPIFYYPIQEDDRATGFLLPTYGSSTFRGQSFSNAFFWAISRNQDATFQHDWYSKAGQAVGAEYRYILNPGSQGNARFSWLDEKTTDPNTGEKSQGDRSYQITGGMAQSLGPHFRARANADYVSSIAPEQLYQQNIYRATRSTRSFGGNLTGSWTQGVLSATMDRTDVFYPDGAYTSYGGLPRVNFARPERRIGKSPFYFGAGAESATIIRDTVNANGTSLPGQDQGLTRLDVTPTLRIPFTKWPFLTLNSAVAWRGTYWTESLVNGQQVGESIWRGFFDFSSTVTGPVFSRIFNAGEPDATKIKHVIEPVFTIRRRTAIDVYDQIVQLDSTDYIRGNVWEVRYGLNNRLYAKRTQSREVLSVALNQTWYTDSLATLTDYYYQSSSYAGTAMSKFTALSLYARAAPTTKLAGDFRTEWDPTFKTLKTVAANGGINNANMQVAAGWSRRRYIPGLPGFDNEALANHYLNASANWHKATNTLGVTYTFNYDLRNDAFLQQRYLAYYNAQCCGINVEYQSYNFSASVYNQYTAVNQDRRFNISFTLAGIGTFSNLLGAFGGQNTR